MHPVEGALYIKKSGIVYENYARLWLEFSTPLFLLEFENSPKADRIAIIFKEEATRADWDP